MAHWSEDVVDQDERKAHCELAKARQLVAKDAPTELSNQRVYVIVAGMVRDFGWRAVGDEHKIECLGIWIRKVYKEGVTDATKS